MKRRSVLLAAVVAVFGLLPATAAVADPNDDPAAFELHIDVPNVSETSSGERVAITGGGEFSVHAKEVDASGEFVATDSQGSLLAAGTWEAIQLISFEFYGCGVIPSIGATLPPNFCGGVLKMRIGYAVTSGPAAGEEGEAILTIFCIVGPQAPTSHDDPSEEGISLVVPGVGNFNRIVGGMNIYIRTD
jgi:hypothetical protein